MTADCLALAIFARICSRIMIAKLKFFFVPRQCSIGTLSEDVSHIDPFSQTLHRVFHRTSIVESFGPEPFKVDPIVCVAETGVWGGRVLGGRRLKA